MKTIIITGASDGLGKAFANLCVKHSIKVINISRTPCNIIGVENIKCDLTNEQDIIKAADVIKNNYAKFDVLINCAGLISLQAPNKITYDELESTMKVNSLAPIFLTSQLFDLIKQNEADIINVGSTVGTKAYPNQAAYITSKWAIRGTSTYWQLEFSKTKCRVIQFNVGGMVSNFWTKYNGHVQENPKEWMLPSDIADLMLYILNLPKQIVISEITINRKGKRE